MQDYEESVARFRRDKDQAFRTQDWSPLPVGARSAFPGLDYYPVDKRYRHVVALERETPERREFPLSTGGIQVQHRVGTFKLLLPSGPVRLAAFRTGPDEDRLFVPFRDQTSGKETYGGGRYLDVRAFGDGRFVVDLNLAYHPYCAYNEAYACPLPPPENWLPGPVRAGERLPADAADRAATH